MTNLETEIKSILNLQSNDSIGVELANRQLAVIIKAYQYLSLPNNNIIYIADEVGLGKTYIAAGIAMLFRHFSKNHLEHKDVIIVPKKNLQDKWKKELKNFVKFNYLSDNDMIKKQFNLDQGIMDKLSTVKEENPITIFRMSSFSNIATPRNKKSLLKAYLINEIFEKNPLAIEVIEKCWELGYFNKDFENHLRKTVAYLLNALSPQIDCLIIDEAHNYKYGIGNSDHDESIRNEATARFLGALYDKQILEKFPCLASRVKFPLANKIICLSATPKDRNLTEIKNQFNCFTKKHILSKISTNDEIKVLLKKFLIRGNLEYLIDGNSISRNQCRNENRLGNVNKNLIPKPLEVSDSFGSIFWQLLQYKSIKHLDQKNNASFEIGMLAGFESYKTDIDKKKSTISNNENEPETDTENKKEYEQTAIRKIKESQDINIIRGIVTSYTDNFSEHPPHPKQTQLENEILDQLFRHEKSLIFVRRVATAYELEKRIYDKYEKEIVIDKQLRFSNKFSKYNTPAVTELIDAYQDKNIFENFNELILPLINKPDIKSFLLLHKEITLDNINKEGIDWFRIAFNNQNNADFKSKLTDFLKRNLVKVSNNLKTLTIEALSSSYKDFQDQREQDSELSQEPEDSPSGYYFLDYFKKGRLGFSYKQKMYRENWFEINPVFLNNYFHFLEYDSAELNKLLDSTVESDKKKNQAFKNAYEQTLSFYANSGKINNVSYTRNSNISGILSENTFLTELLLNYCAEEMNSWIQKRITSGNSAELALDIKILNCILRNVFRNGSGLLPGFIAESTALPFNQSLIELLSSIDSPFYFVLEEIKTIIRDYDLLVAVNFQEKDEKKINSTLRNLTPVVGTSGQDKRDRGILASQFRMPCGPYVLITTDIFREGEDLHTYCQNIYHYGIAWNPSDMEQRTGRIDRINSMSYRKLNKTQELTFENMIHIFYPYLKHSVEVNQVIQLLLNLNKFLETFNDINLNTFYESKVTIDKHWSEDQIPPPITERLISLFDVHDFQIQ